MEEALIAIGAFGFGLVLGWTSAFVAPTRGGFAFRVAVAALAAASLTGMEIDAGLPGSVGLALGMAIHEALLLSIARRFA